MYDLIIVGAGTAGCVLAERLTRSGKLNVLLVEAGGQPSSPFVKIPAGFSKLFQSKLDWNYLSEPLSTANHRQIYIPRGRMLGGSANINAMIHQWGHPDDFARWEAAGAKGWGWGDVAPIFREQEQTIGGGELRGHSGPMHIDRPARPLALAQAFVESAHNAGLKGTAEYNGATYAGAWFAELAYKNNRRFSVYDAYLRPAMQRNNLEVMTNAHVCKVLFNNRRASGLVISRRGQEQMINAGGVVLAAGVFGTPQILMLSGVGPAQHLREHGIPVICDVPGVGKNLQDHPMVMTTFRSKNKQTFKAAANPLHVLRYLAFKSGLLTSNVTEAMAFTKTRFETADAPDLELLFCPLEWLDQGVGLPKVHAFGIAPIVVNPRSRGQVLLNNADPVAPPVIDLGLLTDPEGIDSAILTEGVHLARKVANTGPLAMQNIGEILPGDECQDNAEILEVIKTSLQTIYHPVGTCRMGGDSEAIVDSKLKVNGCEGLWIADASVMPVIPRGHPNSAVAMIAQRASEWLCEYERLEV